MQALCQAGRVLAAGCAGQRRKRSQSKSQGLGTVRRAETMWLGYGSLAAASGRAVRNAESVGCADCCNARGPLRASR